MEGITTPNTRNPNSKQIAKRKKLKVAVPVGNGFRYALLDAEQLSDICRISKSHAYRWINGVTIIPEGYMDLIKIKAMGFLPDREWWGWSVTDGFLVSPAGFKFNPEELDQVQYIRDQNRLSETEIEKLQHQVKSTKKALLDYCQGQKKLIDLETLASPETNLCLSRVS